MYKLNLLKNITYWVVQCRKDIEKSDTKKALVKLKLVQENLKEYDNG